MTPEMILEKQIGDFGKAIEPLKDAYKFDNFSYVSIRTNAGFVLVRGYLHLAINDKAAILPPFESANVRAGHFRLKEMNIDRAAFISQICSGTIETPNGDILFQPNNRNYGAHFQPYHPEGSKNQRRLGVLQLFGADIREHLDIVALDWELRGASPPYDGLSDLLGEYRLFSLSDISTIEIVAYEVCAIDNRSTVEGETAHFIVEIAPELNPAFLRIGYRIFDRGAVSRRGYLPGASFSWATEDGQRIGRLDFAVGRAAVVHAIASYGGIAQHHYFFGDPSTFQNPRRAALEALDIDQSLFDEVLGRTLGRHPDSRSFEAAVGWLLWMQGFNPVHIHGPAEPPDCPDLIVSTPSGHFAVVECTIGLLKAGHKLQHLHDRATAIRRGLDASNQQHLRVLPIIVTAKNRDEIRPDIEEAQKLGIYVITRSQLEAAIAQTILPSNADVLYERAESAVQQALTGDHIEFDE